MATILIKATQHDPDSSNLTGLSFTVKFGQAVARVSIQETPPLPFQDRLSAYRAAIEDLAQAMLLAVQDSHGITENPEP
jgi:hypothetical protein